MITFFIFSFYLNDVLVVKEGVMRITSPALIKREILVKKGDWIDSLKLSQIEVRLRDLKLFTDVEVYPKDSLSDTTDLIVKIKEFWYLWPIINLYHSSETGWNFGAGVYFANFRGMNQRLSFYYNFIGESSFTFGFEDPWTRGHTYHWGVDLYEKRWRRRIEEFTQNEKGVKINYGRNINPYISWTLGGYIKEVSSDKKGKTVSEDNKDLYLKPYLEILWDTKDSEENPSQGFKKTFIFSYTKGIEPDFTIHEIEGDLRFYKKVFSEDILAIQACFNLNIGDIIPAYRKEYLGGEESVRGWDYGTLRGNHSLFLSFEYRIPIYKIKKRDMGKLKNVRWGVSWYNFYDVGWTADSLSLSYDFLRNLPGIDGFGAGLVFFIPYIRMVRFQLAYRDGWHPGVNLSWKF